MATKIRLRRGGKKKHPIYQIVVIDGRKKRDGLFIEKIGTYNPNKNPATITLNFESALNWVMKGAQPTNTVRAILSYKGVMHKKHLLVGVRKGAFSEEEAEKRFSEWMEFKENKIKEKIEKISSKDKNTIKDKIIAEKDYSDKKIKNIKEKNNKDNSKEEAPS